MHNMQTLHALFLGDVGACPDRKFFKNRGCEIKSGCNFEKNFHFVVQFNLLKGMRLLLKWFSQMSVLIELLLIGC